jgi:hypothetical protein
MKTSTWARAALLLSGMACVSLPAWGQSCALCYTQAALAGPRLVQALRSGILVLIFPPMVICIALTVMSYRKRNCFSCQDPDRSASDLGW